LQHSQAFLSQQSFAPQSQVHSSDTMISSITVAIFNHIGQLPQLSGDLVAVQSISPLAAYFVESDYIAFSKNL
tara:strand:- start:9536 stop:9754 length:219 start_codon:yes stop_codon:yes gene_type:complete